MIARAALLLIFFSLSLGALFMLYEYRAPIPSTIIIEATGILESHVQTVEPILHIDMRGAGILHITQEEGLPTLRIEADQAIIPFLESLVVDKTLKITDKTPDNTQFNTAPPHYYLFVPDLASISARGNAHIISQNTLQIDSLDVNTHGNATIELAIESKQLDIQSYGASSITLIGTAIEQHLELHGTTRYNGHNLETVICSIQASGAFIAQIWALQELNGSISGSGKITFRDNPQIFVTQNNSTKIEKFSPQIDGQIQSQ